MPETTNADLLKSQKLAMFMNVEVLNASHEAILQTLNRDIGGYYFPADSFANNVNDWSGIPIVYASDHPDLKLFAENPKLALDKIKGRIVGQVTTPRVETVGHPRLMANMDINDAEVNRLIQEGKISHSTGFIGMVNGKNVTAVTPNHVLVFMEDANNLPKDRGAFILNKEEDETMTEDGLPVNFNNAGSTPYGNVEYADPGYQTDGVKRYPIDTEAHVRAAWSYINMPKNQKMYTADQLRSIKAKIITAAKKYGIVIHNSHLINTETDMANQNYTKDDITKMLDFITANPGMADATMMDKLFGILDPTDQGIFINSILSWMQANPQMVTPEMQTMMDGLVGGTDTGATGGMMGHIENAGAPPTTPPTHAEVATKKKAIVDGLGNLQDYQIVKMFDMMKRMMTMTASMPATATGGIVNKEQETEDIMGKEIELGKQLEISNKEKETLKAELTKKEEQLKAFEQKETERLKAESDARWQEIKNKLEKTGQAGIIHKPEDEASLRNMYESNKDAFYMKHFVSRDPQMLPGEEGKEFMNLTEEQKAEAKAKQGFTVGGSHTTEA